MNTSLPPLVRRAKFIINHQPSIVLVSCRAVSSLLLLRLDQAGSPFTTSLILVLGSRDSRRKCRFFCFWCVGGGVEPPRPTRCRRIDFSILAIFGSESISLRQPF